MDWAKGIEYKQVCKDGEWNYSKCPICGSKGLLAVTVGFSFVTWLCDYCGSKGETHL